VTQIPFRNNTGAEILICLEPDDDIIPVQPGETCTICLRDEMSDLDSADFLIEFSPGLVSVCLICDKTVFINDRQVW